MNIKLLSIHDRSAVPQVGMKICLNIVIVSSIIFSIPNHIYLTQAIVKSTSFNLYFSEFEVNNFSIYQ